MRMILRKFLLIGGLFYIAFATRPLAVWAPPAASQAGYTRVDLTEAGTGREIYSAVLKDGEQVVLTWKHSISGHDVTEVFESRGGILLLTRVTFAGPPGSALPEVSPADVDDLYQTGDPFTARGLAKPFRQVVYRVSQIGEPKMKIGHRVVDFKEEVGFGGGIMLNAREE